MSCIDLKCIQNDSPSGSPADMALEIAPEACTVPDDASPPLPFFSSPFVLTAVVAALL